jgi:hypothetical protein
MRIVAPARLAAVLRAITEHLDHGMLGIEHRRKCREDVAARPLYETPAPTVGAGSRVPSSSS